ncbi:DUF3726 domain-containing protein [Marivivens marinus]|uniref:DUF3726 domain-containing protein n=1 Tax=Marivivens marinus TaxID=3110173 RepID=UPI003B848203
MTAEPNDPTRAGTDWTDSGEGKVTLSQNEVETLCSKAARGAGMSWGLAEEAGVAAGWLAARGIDGPAALLTYLQAGVVDCRDRLAITSGGWSRLDAGLLCPIALGATISDFAGTDLGPIGPSRVSLGPTAAPILLMSFLAGAARRTGQTVCLDWAGGAVKVGSGEVAPDGVSELLGVQNAAIGIQALSDTNIAHLSQTVCRLDRRVIEALNSFAMKTTVPPSEKSRADAGAGESDND